MLSITEINMIAERVAQLTKPADEIMDIERAAEYLNTTREALAQRVCRRQVPFHKTGGLLYFSRNELNAHYLSDGESENIWTTPRRARKTKSFAK
jgi:hypothetical protein|nr:MAG TPA_asm: Pyocin activator protein PrtN [Caudoviricetes sp.]